MNHCLKQLKSKNRAEILQLIGLIKIASGTIETHGVSEGIKMLQSQISTILPSKRFNLFVDQIKMSKGEFPVRFKVLMDGDEAMVGKWDIELKQAMKIDVSDDEYLESFYKQFNIFEEMSENKCQKIMYGDVVVEHDRTHMATIKYIEGQHIMIGAWFR
jgi:hypothetical protein